MTTPNELTDAIDRLAEWHCDAIYEGSPERVLFDVAEVGLVLAEMKRLKGIVKELADAITYDPECEWCTSGDYYQSQAPASNHPNKCAMKAAEAIQAQGA